ncbi:MAG: hypothetical protein IJC39_00355 [Firmicutes bacterium]|nr:hypothetical protein [Bacillota bacterium]
MQIFIIAAPQKRLKAAEKIYKHTKAFWKTLFIGQKKNICYNPIIKALHLIQIKICFGGMRFGKKENIDKESIDQKK